MEEIKPDPKYRTTREYIPNQLISTYNNGAGGYFECILKLDGTGNFNTDRWITSPNYWLYKDGEEIGKIVKFRRLERTRLNTAHVVLSKYSGSYPPIVSYGFYTLGENVDILDPG